MSKVAILLSTYNGEKFISQQLDSLLNQTYEDWICIIRDDGSKDNTLKIINNYVKNHQNKFLIIENSNENLKPCKSFLTLLKASPSLHYYMFCDQDDIWERDKIKTTYYAMIKGEKEYGKDIPLLVHSDLQVVDEGLRIIAPSMKALQKSRCDFNKVNHLILQNNVTGCTVMINEKLRDYANVIPQNAIMHDWWLSLIASCLGEIIYLDSPLIKYRQHSNNSVGAHGINISNILMKVLKLNGFSRKYFKYVNRVIQQASEFFTLYETKLKQPEKDILITLIKLKEKNLFSRLFLLRKYNIKGQNNFYNLLVKTLLVFSK